MWHVMALVPSSLREHLFTLALKATAEGSCAEIKQRVTAVLFANLILFVRVVEDVDPYTS